jgi:hypothetical protein
MVRGIFSKTGQAGQVGKSEVSMVSCTEMKKGDVFVCKNCGLELKVEKPCSCSTGQTECTVPLQCCGGDMTKK